MSVRIKPFLMDGEPVNIETADGEIPLKLASMAWKPAHRYVDEGREFLRRKNENDKPPTNEEWENRMLATVNESLRRAGNPPKGDLLEQFDIPTVTEMEKYVLILSGLRPVEVEAGKSQAAPEPTPAISTNSAAA